MIVLDVLGCFNRNKQNSYAALISCGAIEVFPPRATLFASPPPGNQQAFRPVRKL